MCGSRWIDLAAQGALLAVDGAAVVGLRLARLARCDAAAMAEASLMVTEKVEGAADLHWRALTGALGTSPHDVASASLAYYRGKVSANRRRLGGD